MNEIESLRKKQEELERDLEELGTQINELEEKKITKSDKRWRANPEERYWYIGRSGAVCYLVEMNDHLDKSLYEIGNYFRTEEEAKRAVEKIKIYTQLKDLALRLNKGKKIDWDNSAQTKWHIYYNHEDGLTTIDSYSYQEIGQIYCLDSRFFDTAKREIGEENLKKLFE